MAAGTLKNCGHIGRLGEYAEAAAARKMAFLATVNNHVAFGCCGVAFPGGTEVNASAPIRFGVGIPTKGDPVVLDIGTSVVAEGKVRVAFNKGQQVPDGWLLDPAGKPTTDPGVLYKEPRGSILPLGGSQAYKGFGIGLVLDMLVGGFSGAPCSTPGAPNMSGNAVFFLVLDIAQFTGAEHFLKEVSGLADNIKACPKADGVKDILVPGDPERRSCAQRRQSGIPLDDGTWKQLTTLAERLKVEIPI